jgi:membrane protein implicated in regulation of membrane protease activity
MAADLIFLYLGCAALLIAAVMLPLAPKLRAGLFAALILSAIVGGQSARVEHIPTLIVAAAD